jgi:hypothetical protein
MDERRKAFLDDIFGDVRSATEAGDWVYAHMLAACLGGDHDPMVRAIDVYVTDKISSVGGAMAWPGDAEARIARFMAPHARVFYEHVRFASDHGRRPDRAILDARVDWPVDIAAERAVRWALAVFNAIFAPERERLRTTYSLYLMESVSKVRAGEVEVKLKITVPRAIPFAVDLFHGEEVEG